MPDAPTLVTVTRAGQVTGVSERQIRRWIAAGRLPVTTGERGRLVDLAAVRRLAGHYAGPPDDGLASDRLLPDDNQHLDRHEPDTALTQALTLVDRLSRENVELAGRCGWLQSELQQTRAQLQAAEQEVRLLKEPKVQSCANEKKSPDSVPGPNGHDSGAERPFRRPWWHFWARD